MPRFLYPHKLSLSFLYHSKCPGFSILTSCLCRFCAILSAQVPLSSQAVFVLSVPFQVSRFVYPHKSSLSFLSHSKSPGSSVITYWLPSLLHFFRCPLASTVLYLPRTTAFCSIIVNGKLFSVTVLLLGHTLLL